MSLLHSLFSPSWSWETEAMVHFQVVSGFSVQCWHMHVLVIRALCWSRAKPFDKFSQASIYANQNTAHPECWHENGTLSLLPVPLPWTECPRDVENQESITDCSLSPTQHILGTARIFRFRSRFSHLPFLIPLTIFLGSYTQAFPQGLIPSPNWLSSIFLRNKSNNILLL